MLKYLKAVTKKKVRYLHELILTFVETEGNTAPFIQAIITDSAKSDCGTNGVVFSKNFQINC